MICRIMESKATQLLQGGIDGFIKARQQLNTLLRQSFGLDEEISA